MGGPIDGDAAKRGRGGGGHGKAGRYPDSPGWKGTDTSREAGEAAAGWTAKLRERCFDAIARSPHGLAADEVAAALGKSVLSVRPRVSELRAAGRIVATGHRVKLAHSGNHAKVWIDARRGAQAVADPAPAPSGAGAEPSVAYPADDRRGADAPNRQTGSPPVSAPRQLDLDL